MLSVNHGLARITMSSKNKFTSVYMVAASYTNHGSRRSCQCQGLHSNVLHRSQGQGGRWRGNCTIYKLSYGAPFGARIGWSLGSTKTEVWEVLQPCLRGGTAPAGGTLEGRGYPTLYGSYQKATHKKYPRFLFFLQISRVCSTV